ncbi:MAG: nucleotidyltransferase domain-containing protein [Candidatus Helarchaeota archaeon]|nr:nucleotidyltransferase domain-containing protein [Candidatus Helarchaeota archaeon]
MKKKIEDIKPILDEIKKNLENFYGNRLNTLILYGSYARGDATDDSDIDLIILLNDMNDTCEEILRFSQYLGDLELIYDTLISILPFDANEFENGHLPVILNAKKEGILVYERG